MRVIKKSRFNALAGYSRLPHAPALLKELEWYASKSEVLIGTIAVDADGEFAAILMGRDGDHRFRCIFCQACCEDINSARHSLYTKSIEILAKGEKFFPQGDEKGKKLDLFNPIYPESKLNSNFQIIRTLPGYSAAREIISEAMHHYRDIDGNFVEQFQTTGFDARLWELYLFIYLAEENLIINRSNSAPDFIVSDGLNSAAIEAVTVQPTQNIDLDTLNLESLTFEKIQELQEHYMPIKFGSPLYSKLKKKYWEMKHVKNKPLVFAIADFHAKQSMLWSSTALHNYLYGNRHEFYYSEDKKLVISPVKIDFHEHNGKKIPSGFFFTEGAENVSAVIFSSSGTISKFSRMGRLSGFGDKSVKIFYQGTCHRNDENSALPDTFFFEVNENYNETWATGLSVFHNPKALIPLSRSLFPSAAHHYFQENGQMLSYLPEFFPYGGITAHLQVKEGHGDDEANLTIKD